MARGWHGRQERRFHTWRRRLHLVGKVRPVLGDHRLVGKSPKGSRQPGGETQSPRRLSALPEVRGYCPGPKALAFLVAWTPGAAGDPSPYQAQMSLVQLSIV